MSDDVYTRAGFYVGIALTWFGGALVGAASAYLARAGC